LSEKLEGKYNLYITEPRDCESDTMSLSSWRSIGPAERRKSCSKNRIYGLAWI